MKSKVLFGLLCCVPLVACDSDVKNPETTNPAVQEIVQKELETATTEYQARGATGIVMNAKTGEIVSMVSVGTVEPMKFVYEMGSHFKVFNTVLAYENGFEKTEYVVDKPYSIRDKQGNLLVQIQDVPTTTKYFEKHKIKKLNADNIFLHASNTGTAQIALALPENAQTEFLHRVNLDKKLELDFGKTERPLLHKTWGPIERVATSFGHGIAITPMHMIASLNAVVNEKYVYPTHTKNKNVASKSVVSPDIAKHIREVLHKKAEQLVDNQDSVKDMGISSATAEKRGKEKSVVTSAFITFPIDNPEYSIFVLIDDPQPTKESNGWRTSKWNVIPTAVKISEQIKPILVK